METDLDDMVERAAKAYFQARWIGNPTRAASWGEPHMSVVRATYRRCAKAALLAAMPNLESASTAKVEVMRVDPIGTVRVDYAGPHTDTWVCIADEEAEYWGADCWFCIYSTQPGMAGMIRYMKNVKFGTVVARIPFTPACDPPMASSPPDTAGQGENLSGLARTWIKRIAEREDCE